MINYLSLTCDLQSICFWDFYTIKGFLLKIKWVFIGIPCNENFAIKELVKNFSKFLLISTLIERFIKNTKVGGQDEFCFTYLILSFMLFFIIGKLYVASVSLSQLLSFDVGIFILYRFHKLMIFLNKDL